MKEFIAIRVEQPIGEFYLVSMESEFLLNVSHSRAAGFEGSEISGNQRVVEGKRTKEISNYINTNNAAFPNSIIVSANYHDNDSLEVDDDKRWWIEEISEDVFKLTVPDENLKICSIIDGQHRINGFRASGLQMKLPCSVFIDLPPSLQAYVFSTINFNQKKVDKSLAYQLFGYQLDESESMRWSPDILGVKLSRVFNNEGPFENRIRLIKQQKIINDQGWEISSAVFIEGVVSLISGNSKKDKYIVNKRKVVGYGSRSDLHHNEKYPLRQFYIEGNDKAIVEIVLKYFTSISKTLWCDKRSNDIVFRSVGMAAQFSFLREILVARVLEINKNMDFDDLLKGFSNIVFDSEYFSARSATKKRILDVFKLKCNMVSEEGLNLEAGDLDQVKQAANL